MLFESLTQSFKLNEGNLNFEFSLILSFIYFFIYYYFIIKTIMIILIKRKDITCL